jgi:hypothetical protein
VFIGFAYFLTHRAAYQLPNFSPLESLSTKYLLYITFLDSTSSTFERLIQAYGQLGWLDTVPNTLIVVSLFIVWIFWVHKNFLSDRNMKFYFFLVVVSLILIIFAIEFSVARTWPHFWQGRYQLPVMIAFIILFSSLAGEKIVYNMNQIVFFTTMGIMYLLFLNFSRYHYGVNDGFPLRIHGGSTFELVIVTINLLLIFSLYFFGARKQLRFLKLH